MAMAHAKVALTLHDMNYLGLGSSYVWDRPLQPTSFAGLGGHHVRELMRAGRLTIHACSSWLGALCESLYQVPCGKLMVPLWPEDFSTGPRERTGSEVTRFLVAADNLRDPRKNILPTLRCLLENRTLAKTRAIVHCLGRNPPDDLRAPEILFHGHLEDPARYRALYDQVDFFLHPSLLDNFPLVIQESLAQGRPVVAMNRGGVGEMIQPGKTGWLYAETAREPLEETFQTCSQLTSEGYRAWSGQCRDFAMQKYSAPSAAADYRVLLAPLANSQ